MAIDGAEAFLRAEEEADRLVDELARLKEGIESYRTAHAALDKAADGVSGLATRLGDITGKLGGVVETLRSIGTPELLRSQEMVTSEVAALRQDLGGTQQSITEALTLAMEQVGALRETLEAAERARHEELRRLQLGMGALATAESIAALRDVLEQHEQAYRTVRTVRNLALGTVGLLMITVVLLGWLAMSLARG